MFKGGEQNHCLRHLTGPKITTNHVYYNIYIYIAYSGRLQKLMQLLANVDSNDYYAYAVIDLTSHTMCSKSTSHHGYLFYSLHLLSPTYEWVLLHPLLYRALLSVCVGLDEQREELSNPQVCTTFCTTGRLKLSAETYLQHLCVYENLPPLLLSFFLLTPLAAVVLTLYPHVFDLRCDALVLIHVECVLMKLSLLLASQIHALSLTLVLVYEVPFLAVLVCVHEILIMIHEVSLLADEVYTLPHDDVLLVHEVCALPHGDVLLADKVYALPHDDVQLVHEISLLAHEVYALPHDDVLLAH